MMAAVREAAAVMAAVKEAAAVREARAAAAVREEPPVVCAGSTPNYSCNTRGMSMRPPDCPCSHNNSGTAQRTAVYCHTTRAAMRAAGMAVRRRRSPARKRRRAT